MRIAVFTWLFLVPLLAFLVYVDVALVSAQSQCQTDQGALLLKLKEELKFKRNESERLEKWGSGTDCCNWDGVKCDYGGRVIGLNLSNESISGGIGNSSLFSLQYLQNLDLSFNYFNTTLPAKFGNLTGLLYLNLSNAGFSGQIPIEISELSNLVSLDLSMTTVYLYIDGAAPLNFANPNLATIIRNFAQIRELYLDGINISANGSEWGPALSSLPNLQVLSMPNCFLSGPFPPNLAQLRSLSIIRLSGNKLSAEVPNFFGDFSNLTELHLDNCLLQGKFPETVFQVRTLEILDLRSNNLLQGYLPHSHGCKGLKALLLSYTDFSGTLPESIGNLQNLSRIELASCNFVGPIPSSVENLSQLAYLDLSINNFNGSLPSFHMAKNLTNINLSSNQLGSNISSTEWDTLQSLVYVDMRNNSLNGSIPSSLFKIPSLQKVMLSYNKFQGQLPDFTNVPSLDTLDLSSNTLQGSIPQTLFNLQKLNVLSLSSNKFNGIFKLERIQQLGNLTALDLSYNNLIVDVNISNSNSFAFPLIKTLKLASCNMKVFPDLSNNSKLFYLDLSDNQIGGVIPKWVWEVGNRTLQYLNLSRNNLVGLHGLSVSSQLSILDISHNKLQGIIPVPPSNAAYVDYSNNRFSSSIPPDIGSSSIFFLSLSNNELRGGIPASICNASYLKVLDFSGNNLRGEIPPCLIELSNTLGVLNLRNNNLDGAIPDQFSEACQLQTLDLSGNNLKGEIPKTLANCKFLEVLNLGSNQIRDIFPCYIKEKTSLRVLVLRSNKFYGSIGCPHVNGTWRRLQIVDLASNNFSGILPAKCLSTWKAMIIDGGYTYKHLSFKPFQLNRLYYEDSVTVTTKGLQMELVKILTVFTSIDISFNNFEGPIPDEIGQFTALYALNMSYNALTGRIPSSLGNLSRLESLDLSKNHLSGQIPDQLVALTFLSFINLSYNNLSGMIPTSTQLQSFSASSYEGNEGLCGPPLTQSCSDTNADRTNVKPRKSAYDWGFIFPGIGFGLGAAMIMAPLLFSKKANKWGDDQIDKILLVLLPMFGLMYYAKTDWRRYADGTSEDNKSDNADDDDGDIENDKEEEEDCQGRYCVFCTKLDITRKRVIHDSKCTCYYSPPLSASSSFYCSSSSSP